MRIGENARIFFSEREKSVPAMRVTTLVNKLIGLQGLCGSEVSTSRRTKPEWWWMWYHGGGSLCAGFADERSARTKIATIATGGTWTCSESGPIFATRSDEWYVGGVEWSEKRCLGRQGKPLYQKLRTRGSVAGTEDGRQLFRSELFPSDVAFGATDHPAKWLPSSGMSGASSMDCG